MLKLLRSEISTPVEYKNYAVQSLVQAQLDSGNFGNCGFQGFLKVKGRIFKSSKLKQNYNQNT